MSNAWLVLLLEIILQWQEFNVFMYENVLKMLWGHDTNNWNEFNENKVFLKTFIKHFLMFLWFYFIFQKFKMPCK